MLHRLRGTPGESGWVHQYLGANAQPALVWKHMLALSHTACSWWLAGPGCKPGAPPHRISSQGTMVLRSSGGVFCPPWCSYPMSSWIAKSQGRKGGQRQKLDSAALHASACQPLGTDCSRKPSVPGPILESYLALSHTHNLPAQNTAL